MKQISKGVWITLILLVVAVGLFLVALSGLLHPYRNKFDLATYEVSVPVREVKVPPFAFENSQMLQLYAALDELTEDVLLNLLGKIAMHKVYVDPKATETAPHDEPAHKIEHNAGKSAVPHKFDKAVLNGETWIAVVIDDMGVSVPHTKNIISLHKPMTASFLTYGAANREQVQAAKDAGFEVMLHVPMMPHVQADLAPITLSPKMSKDEIQQHLTKMLARYEGMGMEGINNHMGSAFTENGKSLDAVMQILKERKMFFLDSKTTSKSAAKASAEKYGVPFIERDVFLDNENDYNYIMKQLQIAEHIAQKHGYAVAICHPRSETYKALRDWVKTLDKKRIKLVHLSDLLALQKK